MAKKRTTKIGKASKACPMYNKKGKRIRTKAERKKCMKRIMKGPKKKRKSRRKKR